uniref:CCR4-NOT transcription complex subunit 9 n=1 Tax=Steinernema glaseri TaxID=37863 RepID=A0A1I7Y6Q7_9BILA
MDALIERKEVAARVAEIRDPSTRCKAIRYLVELKDSCPYLAELLAETTGVIDSIFQELATLYPHLEPHSLTAQMSGSACNALALLQVIAADKITRPLFIKNDYALCILPFLYYVDTSWTFEHLRLASLGVLGSLLKEEDNDEVVIHLIGTPIIPLCLQIMERDVTIIMSLATFVLQKILASPSGLLHCCATPERITNVLHVLNLVVTHLTVYPNSRLLKLVMRCYISMTGNDHAFGLLKHTLPQALRDNTFDRITGGSISADRDWQVLHRILSNDQDHVKTDTEASTSM